MNTALAHQDQCEVHTIGRPNKCSISKRPVKNIQHNPSDTLPLTEQDTHIRWHKQRANTLPLQVSEAPCNCIESSHGSQSGDLILQTVQEDGQTGGEFRLEFWAKVAQYLTPTAQKGQQPMIQLSINLVACMHHIELCVHAPSGGRCICM